MDNNEKQDFNEKQDIRDRKFGEVVLPKPPKQITNRDPPTAKELGPLADLLGLWHANGTGWNMIALPFQGRPGFPAPFKFRILMNRYDEELKFVFIDDKVPNRGLERIDDPGADQFTVTVDYQQKISQVHAEDIPDSGGLAGLWMTGLKTWWTKLS